MAESRGGPLRRLWESLTSPPSVFSSGRTASDDVDPGAAPTRPAGAPSEAPTNAGRATADTPTKPSPGPQGRPSASAAEPIAANIADSLAEIPHPSLPKGSSLYGSTKLFADYEAREGQSYFTLVHGVAHESSVSFVAVLQATRALRKGFESALYFYGPGALNCIANRGFPTTGDAAFPGETNLNGSIETFIAEGGTVFCCRFGLALHGMREADLIEGVIPAHPLDVQDAVIHYANKGAVINSTYLV